MAGPDGVDVVLFHGDQILPDDLLSDHPAGLRTEFMTIYAFKYDPLSVQEHDAVLDLKAAETDLFLNDLTYFTRLIKQQQGQIIELRILRTPQFRRKHRDLQFVPDRILSAEGGSLLFFPQKEGIVCAADFLFAV